MQNKTPLSLTALALIAGCAASEPLGSQPAPIIRPTELGGGAAAPQTRPQAPAPQQLAAAAPVPAGFAAWRERFRGRARAAGISDATYDAAMRGVSPNASVLKSDAYQPEFTKAIWDYLDAAVSDARIARGRELFAAKRTNLSRIEAKYGVDAKVLMAIWGGESNYGGNYGNIPVAEALATLAYEGRRRSFGEDQLLAALKILQAGDVTPQRMVGSWAGAMGHTQFIPTSYLEYAVDFTGDGKRDLWSADALDALASAANYLARAGWKLGQPWGLEVALPQGINYALADGKARNVNFWSNRGVRALGGGSIPNAGPAKLLLPAGAQGPAFLTFGNFEAIKRYNNATSYALAINHLADRIAGAGPFQQSWPRGERSLSRNEAEEMQRLLTVLGFDTQGTDGILGPNSRDAIRRYQAARGLTPDGFESSSLLTRLRREAGG